MRRIKIEQDNKIYIGNVNVKKKKNLKCMNYEYALHI